MKNRILSLCFLLPFFCYAQNDLLDEFEENIAIGNYTGSAFKGLKIVNFESTRLIAKNDFYFAVTHRLGSIDTIINDFFGMDRSVTRFQFIVGVSDWLNLAVARSSFQKTYDVSVKYRLLRQKKGGFPFTIVGYNQANINTALDKELLPKLEFENRLSYTSQLLISRKFNKNLSIQVMPTFFHENYVSFDDQENSQIVIGIGGRHKLTRRWSINIDYGYHLNRASESPFNNPLSIGFDLETGENVFQMHFTNAQAMFESGFLGQAVGNWSDGVIYFGFSLSRVF